MARRRERTPSDAGVQLSAFGGHLLEHVSGLVGAALAALSDVGIGDAEQLLAAAAAEGVKEHLAQHLNISREALEALVNKAKRVLPPRVLRHIEEPLPQVFCFGALEPPPEMRAEAAARAPALEAAAPPSLPAAANLIDKMSPIRNQGQRGTCVAFALTAINEYMRRVKGLPDNDLSEQHLYFEAKSIDGDPRPGTFQRFAAQVLANRGECRNVVWPYNPNPPNSPQGPLPVNARADGLNYRVQLQQLPPRSVATVKSMLASGRPVGMSLPVYASWYGSQSQPNEYVRRTGRISMRLGNEAGVGGHAVCLVGYQDQAADPGGGSFILRNSWDTKWGYECPHGAGYGTIPYQYLANDCWEAYTLQEPVEPPPPPKPPGPWLLLFTARLAGGETHRWFQEQWSASTQVGFQVVPKPPQPSASVEMATERFVEADGSVTYFFDITNRASAAVDFDVQYRVPS